jgi:hypothetical protein
MLRVQFWWAPENGEGEAKPQADQHVIDLQKCWQSRDCHWATEKCEHQMLFAINIALFSLIHKIAFMRANLISLSSLINI